jgi:hypothetical protein
MYEHTIKDALRLAEKKSGIDGWTAYLWKRANGGAIVEGCVPDGVYSRGAHKGRPRFSRPKSNTLLQVIVTDTELEIEARNYESNAGFCWNCKGSGKNFSGWDRDTGTRYVPCARCKSTGSAP